MDLNHISGELCILLLVLQHRSIVSFSHSKRCISEDGNANVQIWRRVIIQVEHQVRSVNFASSMLIFWDGVAKQASGRIPYLVGEIWQWVRSERPDIGNVRTKDQYWGFQVFGRVRLTQDWLLNIRSDIISQYWYSWIYHATWKKYERSTMKIARNTMSLTYYGVLWINFGG